MTDFKKLTVSLTKHGAHKLAILLRKLDSSQILSNLWGKIDDVNIDEAQAKKNLSAKNSFVPLVWDKARELGGEAIDALVLIGIIFSHKDLLHVMAVSRDSRTPFAGTIVRGAYIDGKAFTNFSHTLYELGYAVDHSKNHVKYNLESIFSVAKLNELVIELLAYKLAAAGWKKTNSCIDELLSHDLHHVFSISEPEWKNWLVSGHLIRDDDSDSLEDISFFAMASDAVHDQKFVFTNGHSAKKTGIVDVSPSRVSKRAELVHNAMQNRLHALLVEKFGEDCVGTEVSTGADTSIDVVVKTPDFCWFYEIKTAKSVKACIRQAIPQLLEYAYWHGKNDRAERLIIVGPAPLTPEAHRYLELLKDAFSLPIFYEQLLIS